MRKNHCPVGSRIKQINREIERLQIQLATKTIKTFKREARYEQWKGEAHELLERLRDELSALLYPGEYEALPPAIVAAELGLSLSQVKGLIRLGEIESASPPSNGWIGRGEITCIAEIGRDELLRLASQDNAEIYKLSSDYLRQGNLALARKGLRRLERRDREEGLYISALKIALLLAEGECAEAKHELDVIAELDALERTTLFALLANLLNSLCFENAGSRAVAELILSIVAGGIPNGLKSNICLDELQQHTLFIVGVVKSVTGEVVKGLPPAKREKLFGIIKDAVFSSTYALATYDRSASSRLFVNYIKKRIHQDHMPAKLIDGLSYHCLLGRSSPNSIDE
jgi:hypothetical protein